jgi:hypothetical protein
MADELRSLFVQVAAKCITGESQRASGGSQHGCDRSKTISWLARAYVFAPRLTKDHHNAFVDSLGEP